MSSKKSADSVGNSIQQMMTQMNQQLPEYRELLTDQILPTEAAISEATQQYSPEYNELQAQLAEDYLPRLAQAQAESQVGTDASMLRQFGPEMARLAAEIETEYDPSFSKVKGEASDKLSELLGDINLDDPNIEAERLISQENQRSGTANQPSATSTVANALSFGREANTRRNQLSQAINTASQFLPATRNAQFNPVATTAGRGQNSFFIGAQPPSQAGFQMGSEFLNILQGLQSTKMMANAQQGSDATASGQAP